MRIGAWLSCVLGVPVLLAGSGAEPQDGKTLKPNDPVLAKLAWMTGTWSSDSGGKRSEECWTVPDSGTMMGVNRSMAAGKTSFFEYLRIESRPDGVFYLASPKGRFPPTEFKLIEQGDRRVTFENPEHDFPQRIIYWREGAALHARIEGKENGQPRSESWTWQRAEVASE